MEEKQCIQTGNILQVTFEISYKINGTYTYQTYTSPDYVVNGLILFQAKVNTATYFNGDTRRSDYNGSIFIRFVKTLQSDKLTYAIKCSSEQFGIKDNTFLSDDMSWRLVHEFSRKSAPTSFSFSFTLTVALDLPSSTSPLASLHDDTDLADFELRGEDGSVHMHKAILAGYSPMLRSMLSGEWRETKEGSIQVMGTTKKTLQDLKDYMYVHKLPEEGLQHLMLLASYYLMEELEHKCSVKLLNKLSAENAFELLQFAVNNKMKKFYLAIMENVQRGNIKVEDMNKFFPSR